MSTSHLVAHLLREIESALRDVFRPVATRGARGKGESQRQKQKDSESLQLVRRTDPEHMVLEHLARIVESYPLESALCLMMIAEADREGWNLYAGRNHVRKILEVALRSPTSEVEAKRIINYLGSRGFLEFRDLLEK